MRRTVVSLAAVALAAGTLALGVAAPAHAQGVYDERAAGSSPRHSRRSGADGRRPALFPWIGAPGSLDRYTSHRDSPVR
jgi:hypothetical protein